MKGYLVLAAGITMLVIALPVAIFSAKWPKHSIESGGWFRAYITLLVACLITTALLLMSDLFVRLISVNAYRNLFDGLSLALIGAFFSGLVLVVRRPRFLVSYFIFICGAVITLIEFFGR